MAMMTYTVVFTVLNLVLLGVLLAIYLNSYRQLRASFSLGLILFASLFLIQKIVAVYIYLILMHSLEEPLAASMFILEILQFLAFGVLAWITVK